MNEDVLDIENARKLLGLEATIEAEAIHADEANQEWRCLPPEDPLDATGDIAGVEDLDPREPTRTARQSGPVGDIVENAGGYTVVTMGAAGMQPLRDCVVCGEPVTNPAAEWVCEFSGDVTDRPMITGTVGTIGRQTRTVTTKCQCNACAWNTDSRSRGRPKEVCSAECQRERQRRERAAERERQNERQRELALRWVIAYPKMTDQDIAAELGIRPVRVKEARRLNA